MNSVRVATFNSPHRLQPHRMDFQRLADQGVQVICAQENTDSDPPLNAPRGWQWHRPRRARSTVVYWNPAVCRRRWAGARRLHSHGWRPARYVVWVHLHTDAGPLRVGSVHLPAFKTWKPQNGREFRRQEKRLARWLRGGKWRVVGGDFNARLPGMNWTPNLTRAGRFSEAVPSGPHNTRIDYVVANRRGQWKPVSTRTHIPTRSDHRAVIVTLERK